MAEFYGEWHGSAKKMLGNNLVLVVFVSPENHVWTSDQKQTNLQEIQKGLDWITQQAQKYNQKPHLQLLPLQMDKDFLLKNQQDRLDLSNNLGKISKELGFVNFSHILSHYRTEYIGYNVVMLFAVNISNEEGGNGYSTSEGELEYGVLYPDIRYENRISIYTTAHELLHAYSAPDLYAYNHSPKTLQAKENAVKYVKNDIMLCEMEIKDFEVSEYTAFTVGWHNAPKDWYMQITPPNFKQNMDFMMRYSQYFDDGGVLNIENANMGRFYQFEYGELKEWFFGEKVADSLSLWTLEEDGEDAYISSVLMREESEDTDYILIKNNQYTLKIPLKDDKGKVLIDDKWQDWYSLTLQNIALVVHYEAGFLKRYDILDKIIWFWDENNPQYGGFLDQYNENDEFYFIKNHFYKFKIPKNGGQALLSYTEYKEDEWANWYKVTVSYF